MSEEAFRFETSVDVRLRDLDPMGHVNNGVYATYLEEAREAYFAAVLDKALLDDVNTVTAKQTIEYERPIDAETDAVDIDVRVADVGDRSLTVEYEARADGRRVATGESVQVVYDVADETSRPVPSEWRERIRRFERGE